MRAAAAGLAWLLLAGVTAAAGAQTAHPVGAWRTLETEHFRFHTPMAFEAWTRATAIRMEAVHAAVRSVVGSVPSARVDVVVDDPSNVSNGSAWAQLGAPAIFLYPVPPNPRSMIGSSRGWGELLAVHEFAHLAHLNRESRHPFHRLAGALLPGAFGPIALKSPRWVTEGYATYIEGVLTGTGRPHAALRAAVLRQWALEGALPSYPQLNGDARWQGGAFAYLQGSAFLEWLGAREGDSSLTALWRRMTARELRSFEAAFRGVYGDAPAPLYQRFVAEQTVDAFALRARLDSAGVVAGTLIQRLRQSTGDPAVSPSGDRMALALPGAPGQPGRLVIWSIGEAHSDSAADSLRARATRRLLARDPEDVAAIDRDPPPRRALHTLHAVAGRAHSAPRWFADAQRLLVTRWDPLADGRLRPELFIWTPSHDRLTRVTTGAGVQAADPSPDGATAVALRCATGTCDVVRVDLSTGTVTAVVPADPAVNWYRPRWLPDGRHVVASRHHAGRWRIAEIDVEQGTVRLLGPDDGAERYDVSVADSGRTLLYVSEAGGVPNLVRFDRASAVEHAITRVTGAALAPESSPADGGVYFLHLSARGLDLHRVTPGEAATVGALVVLAAPSVLLARRSADAVRASIAPRGPFLRDSFAVGQLRADRPYGLGPHRPTMYPAASVSVDGASYGGVLRSADPIGRLSWTVQGRASDRRHWRGGALSAVWRGWPVPITADLFSVAQDLGAALPSLAHDVPAALAGDTRWRGGAVRAAFTRRTAAGAAGVIGQMLGALDRTATLQVGVASGAFRAVPAPAATDAAATPAVRTDGDRHLGYLDATFTLRGGRGAQSRQVTLHGHAATGSTGGVRWTRQSAGLQTSVGAGPLRVRLDGQMGVASSRTPSFEQFALGGTPNPLLDGELMQQRVPLPGLPQVTTMGRRMHVARASLPVGMFEAYGTTYHAGDALGSARARVVGVESRLASSAVPHGRIPRMDVLAGVARSLSGALADHTTVYATLRYRP